MKDNFENVGVNRTVIEKQNMTRWIAFMMIRVG